MKKIKDIITNLYQYSHVKDQYIRELSEYIVGIPKLPQQKKLKVLVSEDKNLAQIVKGIRIYYSLYGRNNEQLMNYLRQAREEGYEKIKDQMSEC